MVFDERTYSVLIVSAGEKFTGVLTSLLPVSNYYPVKTVSSISSAERAMLDRQYDFVIVNTPLPDDFGTRFAIDCCSKSSVCLLFVKTDIHDDIFSKVVSHGVFTLPKPTSSQMIDQALGWMAASRERLRKQEKKTTSIEDKMAEIRIVNRAKWLLIDNLKMSESDAHRYIEKQAMDRCIAKKAVAENIIKMYG